MLIYDGKDDADSPNGKAEDHVTEAGKSSESFSDYLAEIAELYVDGYTVVSIGLSSTFDSVLSHL